VLVGVFVGVLVAVFVGVLVGVSVGVFVGVLVGVSVGVFVAVFVGVLVGVSVGVFVGVLVGVSVGVLVTVFVGVSVGVLVAVFAGVLVGVSVAVLVGVMVGVSVGVLVAVLVGVSVRRLELNAARAEEALNTEPPSASRNATRSASRIRKCSLFLLLPLMRDEYMEWLLLLRRQLARVVCKSVLIRWTVVCFPGITPAKFNKDCSSLTMPDERQADRTFLPGPQIGSTCW
jgi:hypothetical protein